MSSTRYEILIKIGDDKYYLDTFKYDVISLNYDIANIRDISGRNSSYSKTIKLPDSEHNREILGFITNLAVDSTVDANKAIKAWVLVDTIPVFEGNLQLKKFQKNFKTGEFDIEIVIFAYNDTFFTTIGEKYISDLDLSGFDHDWTADNIRFSWTQSTGYPYRYPLIDYGSNWSMSDLNGKILPGATQGTATQSLTVDEMYPAISRKIIFDKIFQESGFNYDSNFLNSDYFKNEYIPFNGIRMSGETRETFEVGLSASIIATQGTPYTLYFNGIIEDEDSLWDFTNNYYVNNGDTISQNFTLNLSGNIINYLGGFGGQGVIRYLEIRFYKEYNNITKTTDPTWASGEGYLFSSKKVFNIFGDADGSIGSFTYDEDGVVTNYTITSGGDFSFQTSVTSDFINTIQNDKVRVSVLLFRSPSSVSQLDISGNIATLKNTYNQYIEPGCRIYWSSVLPKKIKQRDFILSACREYNLYIEPSKEYQNTLIIEPRDDYYANGKIKDWTSKLGLNQPIEVDILAETQNKITVFSHKEDKDYLNQNYKQTFNEIYGQYDFDSGNEFAKSQNKKIESIFSPTPLNLVPGSVGLIIPLITKDTLFSYNADSKGKLDTNIRTLQWGGLVEFNNDFDRINFDGQYITSNGNYAYPYAGHLDNPYEPTVDNNFGDPIDVYFPNNGLTTNNLFNRFWYKTMFELTNKDSRILTANFFLTPEDIYNFRFSDKIYIFLDGNGQYYKVNKIFDFDPGTTKSTKVELLRTFDVQVNTFKAKFLGKGGGVRVPPRVEIGVGKVETDVVDIGNNNTIKSDNTLVNGNSNYVDIGNNSILVNGNNNVIDWPNKNVAVIGDMNKVDSLVKNSIIIGDSNQVATYSENVYTFGDNNIIGTASENIYILGNNNTVSDGVTYSYVFGDYIAVTQSNTTYFSTKVIFSGGVEGLTASAGLQEVLDYNDVAYDTKFSIVSDNIVSISRDTDDIEIDSSSPDSIVINSNNVDVYGIAGVGKNIIMSSDDASITFSSNASIISSPFSQLKNARGSVILGGEQHDISDTGTSPFSTVYRSVIVGGLQNRIVNDGQTCLYNSILSGFNNEIDSSTYSLINGGRDNTIMLSNNSSIIGGIGNNLNDSGKSNIITSEFSSMTASDFSLINSGQYTTVSNSNYTTSISDRNSEITDSMDITSIHNTNISVENCDKLTLINVDGTDFNGINNSFISITEDLTIESSSYSVAFNSKNLDIDNSQYVISLGGVNNTLQDLVDSQIIGGVGNFLTYSTNSMILGGVNNRLSSPGYGQGNTWGNSVIVGGESNIIGQKTGLLDYGGGWDVIVGGEANRISGFYSVISAGANNDIGLTHGVGNYSFIGGGLSNKIYSTYDEAIVGDIARDSGIIAGQGNTIRGRYQFIGGGFGNTLYVGASSSVILGGQYNYIGTYSVNSGIVSGYDNHSEASNTGILGGDGNTIHQSADYSGMLGGQSNRLGTASTHCAFVGGFNNEIKDGPDRVIMLGGTGMVGTQSDVVYSTRQMYRRTSDTPTLITSVGWSGGLTGSSMAGYVEITPDLTELTNGTLFILAWALTAKHYATFYPANQNSTGVVFWAEYDDVNNWTRLNYTGTLVASTTYKWHYTNNPLI